MNGEIYKIAKRARADLKRAMSAAKVLCETIGIGGHIPDQADGLRLCLDTLICSSNIEIDDYELATDNWRKHKEQDA